MPRLRIAIVGGGLSDLAPRERPAPLRVVT
jgi:hypothetical protein